MMAVLDYYISKQNDPRWVEMYQSIGSNCYGKSFSYYSTNFRKVISFGTQLKNFEHVLNKPRSSWPKNEITGQEDDKQRVVNLVNAGFIEGYSYNNSNTINAYRLTPKGSEVLNLMNLKTAKSITEWDCWILIFLLLLDFRTQNDSLTLIKEAVKINLNVESLGIQFSTFISQIQEVILSSDKEDLFSKEGFWLITFNRDPEFLKRFINATTVEKESLYNWVKTCSKNDDSKDCIAHKFVKSGRYTCGYFVDEAFTLLLILIVTSLKTKDYNSCVNFICGISTKLGRIININFVLNRISNENVYQDTYSNSIVKIINNAGGHNNE